MNKAAKVLFYTILAVVGWRALRYFSGRFLAADDLEAEQSYDRARKEQARARGAGRTRAGRRSPTRIINLERARRGAGGSGWPMKCPYCRRPVRMFAFERKHLLRKILPYCRICNRYVLSWVHLILIVGLVIAVLVLALKLVPPI